jgi:hypothetical protein
VRYLGSIPGSRLLFNVVARRPPQRLSTTFIRTAASRRIRIAGALRWGMFRTTTRGNDMTDDRAARRDAFGAKPFGMGSAFASGERAALESLGRA